MKTLFRYLIFIIPALAYGPTARANQQCVYEAFNKAVVEVLYYPDQTDTDDTAIYGTGFVISPDGWILTARHVLEREDGSGTTGTAKVRIGDLDANPIPAAIMKRDDFDFALLKVDKEDLPYVRIREEYRPKIGLNVLGISYIKDSGRSLVAESPITKLNIISPRSSVWQETRMQVERSASGGPVFGPDGLVVGMLSSAEFPSSTSALSTRTWFTTIRLAHESLFTAGAESTTDPACETQQETTTKARFSNAPAPGFTYIGTKDPSGTKWLDQVYRLPQEPDAAPSVGSTVVAKGYVWIRDEIIAPGGSKDNASIKGLASPGDFFHVTDVTNLANGQVWAKVAPLDVLGKLTGAPQVKLPEQ
ncbi:hypothetical protein GCM10010520_23070 [Rhizobium viscosum]|uniref:Serine protease n=1 Tax=Rhizobium viscosum TaxID=1673 RepID=A0ABR9IIR8_RHIVS|nr:serine protease [Rhizobium viscosum]MBE1503080.1 hypothetical protein [Rhizobium viscosum]